MAKDMLARYQYRQIHFYKQTKIYKENFVESEKCIDLDHFRVLISLSLICGPLLENNSNEKIIVPGILKYINLV